MKKLFISDLDGTLLKIGNEYSAGVSEENKNIIQKYIANGNLFAIASARGHKYLPVISEMLGFTPDYIGGNGTELIIEGKSEMFYLDFGFYSLLKQAVVKDSLSATVILQTEKASYCEDRDAYPFGFENPLHTPDMFKFSEHPVPEDFSVERPISIAVFVEPERMELVKQKLRDRFSSQVEIVSSDIDLINITPKGCTKASGILRLMEYYELKIDDVGVVGDSDNDVNMFDVTKFSYCMDHSEDFVKNRASKIVKSVAEALVDFADLN
ncbi:MAG: HAD-IIB family hydrolase [Erysipelotrichaceae bacterium]|nr:HAD-IIB family hydrolase [Erysipelotrichaceae bacterium]